MILYQSIAPPLVSSGALWLRALLMIILASAVASVGVNPTVSLGIISALIG